MPSAQPQPAAVARPPLGPSWRGESNRLLPLQGLTILTVEDSRFACEALRLLCQRAGGRLRRADSLAAAHAHLRVYRPDVVIIDLGLPDGPGEALIRALVMSATRRPAVVLGTSGDPAGRLSALAAGADGFLEKPLRGMSALCDTLRRFFPVPEPGWAGVSQAALFPDPLALRDDLAHAAEALAEAPDPARRHYISGFVAGIARHAQDAALAQAASRAGQDQSTDLQELRSLIDSRLAGPMAEFAPGEQ